MKPLVTVITTTYNILEAGREEFFKQCVHSVKMQNYPNIEHIIVDGKSSDGSLALFQEMGLVYYSEKDSSIYNAFNKGVKLAKGQYIIFLNSDDYFINEHAVSTLAEALMQSKCDFTCSDYEEIAEDCSVQRQIPRFKCFYLYNPFCHQTVLASKNMLLDLNGFDERFKIYADYDLLLRALIKGYSFSYIDQVTVGFRKGGVSSDFTEDNKLELIEIYKNVYKISDKNAQRLSQYGCLPAKVLKALLKKMHTFAYSEDAAHYNTVCLFKYYFKQCITFKFTKGKRLVRILGLTLYDEEKKV